MRCQIDKNFKYKISILIPRKSVRSENNSRYSSYVCGKRTQASRFGRIEMYNIGTFCTKHIYQFTQSGKIAQYGNITRK